MTLRLEARYKNCKILGQNGGTFVTFLRDKTVTYPATGMAQVSSVVLKCKVGDTLEKGEKISLQFGGSDIVLEGC